MTGRVRRCAGAGGCRAGLATLVAAVILAGSGGALAPLNATSRARAAPVNSPVPCDGSVGSSIFLYGSSTRTLSETTIPVCAAGGVTVSFHSTAAGCSAGGPCGYTGLESWRPAGGGMLSLATVRSRGRDATEAVLSLGFGAPVLETVTRTGPAGRSSTCQDRSGQFSAFLSPRVRAGRLTMALGDSRQAAIGAGQSALLGTECAGPFDADLGAALPAASFALGAVRAGHTRLDLSGAHPFASRDFAGEVSSGLVLTLGRARPGRASSGAPGRGQRIRNLFETYRVQRLQGGIAAHVTGASDPAICARLDNCGAHGSIEVVARARSRGALYVTASGPARRPIRDFRAALGRSQGGDPAGITVDGGGQAPVLGGITAAMRAPDRCRDATAITAVGLRLHARGGRMQVTLSGAGLARDPLRTRCPGPALGSRALAVGSVPLNAFGQPTISVTLHGVRVAAGTYRLRNVGGFSLRLRRTGQSIQIFRLGF